MSDKREKRQITFVAAEPDDAEPGLVDEVRGSLPDASELRIVKSYVTKEETEISGTIVPKGSLLVTAQVIDDGLWMAIKAGHFNSVSVSMPMRLAPPVPWWRWALRWLRGFLGGGR